MLQVGATTIQRLSQHRREQLRPHVSPMYKALCNRPDKEDLELVGADIEAKIAEMGRSKSIHNAGSARFLHRRPSSNWRDKTSTSNRGLSASHGRRHNSRYSTTQNQHGGGKMRARPHQKPKFPNTITQEQWKRH